MAAGSREQRAILHTKDERLADQGRHRLHLAEGEDPLPDWAPEVCREWRRMPDLLERDPLGEAGELHDPRTVVKQTRWRRGPPGTWHRRVRFSTLPRRAPH